jgi:nicotinate-nucleotide--dimethylbenzimidazole phosphoribosyltransferase
MIYPESDLMACLNRIGPVDGEAGEQAARRQNSLTKPPGSLGRLERIVIELAMIQRREIPVPGRKVIFTLAGDHGVTAEGVSAYPAVVTAQMVRNFIAGGAAVNALAAHAGADVVVADFGVAADLDIQSPNFRNCKVGYGTANFARGPAMSREQAVTAVARGIELFESEMRSAAIGLTGIGEMGIGNSSAAAAILAVIGDLPPEQAVGRGTGVDDAGLARKIDAIRSGLERNDPDRTDALDILAKVGGFEIGGMAGVMLAAAAHRVAVLCDGFISTAAAMLAVQLCPAVSAYLIASHRSREPGHRLMLELLAKDPILDLDLRLGEGTGAALAMTIIEAACRVHREMANFARAHISDRG